MINPLESLFPSARPFTTSQKSLSDAVVFHVPVFCPDVQYPMASVQFQGSQTPGLPHLVVVVHFV